MASSRFWVAERSFWQVTTIPVGRWVSRIADSVFWTCWPPAPDDAERVHPDLVPVELDLDVVVRLGHDLDQGERRLAPVLGVVRADPDEAVDAALGAQPAVGEPPGDGDGRALDPGLLAGLLVDDVGLEPVALAPAEVHPQEHLGPVGRLGPARAGADREHGVLRVVLAGEQQQGPLARELRRRGRRPRARGRPRCRRRACRRGGPASSSRSAARFSSVRQRSTSSRRPSASRTTFCARALVVPEPGLDGAGVELRDAGFLGGEVKDAPRSTGSAPRGPEWRRRPSSARTWRSWSRIGRSSISRRAVLLRATTGFTQGQYELWGQTPQLPSQSRAAA